VSETERGALLRSSLLRLRQSYGFGARSDGLLDGYYRTGASRSRRVGSCGGYSWWRDALCQRVHGCTVDAFRARSSDEGAFGELISFSDCDGFIGPKTCTKLHADFVAHTNIGEDAELGWRFKAIGALFAFAADGGVVDFH